jgi:hypothetical protein
MSDKGTALKASPEQSRRVGTYKIVIDALDKVCARLGWIYELLHQGYDTDHRTVSRIDVLALRFYGEVGFVSIDTATEIAIDWDKEEIAITAHTRDNNSGLVAALQDVLLRAELIGGARLE